MYMYIGNEFTFYLYTYMLMYMYMYTHVYIGALGRSVQDLKSIVKDIDVSYISTLSFYNKYVRTVCRQHCITICTLTYGEVLYVHIPI